MQNHLTPLPSNVPRETFDKLHEYESLILKWQKSVNLLSQNTSDLWQRHILDSLQLAEYFPQEGSKTVFDLGSGGGLPGIVLACALPQHQFYLIESDRKKAIFLSECVRQLGLGNAHVANQRAEEFSGKADIITARALAEVSLLLHYSYKFFHSDTDCLFLKGKNYAMEIAQAQKDWQFEYEAFPSHTSAEGVVLKISQLRRITD